MIQKSVFDGNPVTIIPSPQGFAIPVQQVAACMHLDANETFVRLTELTSEATPLITMTEVSGAELFAATKYGILILAVNLRTDASFRFYTWASKAIHHLEAEKMKLEETPGLLSKREADDLILPAIRHMMPELRRELVALERNEFLPALLSEFKAVRENLEARTVETVSHMLPQFISAIRDNMQ